MNKNFKSFSTGRDSKNFNQNKRCRGKPQSPIVYGGENQCESVFIIELKKTVFIYSKMIRIL